MQDDLRSRVLNYLNAPDYTPLKPAILSRHLRLAPAERREFHELIDTLTSQGQIRTDRKGRLQTKSVSGSVVGVIKKISSGGAYLYSAPGHPPLPATDIYIPPEDLRDAHQGDLVEVRISKRQGDGGKRYARVDEVVSRATQQFVGTYGERNGQGFVIVDGEAFQEQVSVGDPGAKGAEPGDKVVIEMLRFPTATRRGSAVLVKILGPAGEPEVDTAAVIAQYGLPEEFPADALRDAAEQAEQFDENDLGGRLDLTGETIVTIDPIDARDFDDAISLKRIENGHWELGVHIADVSHFVKAGSALDQEAARRATSVYLPGLVIPMLPELISNGLASLQQGQVRYTKSVFIEYDPEGRPVNTRFANSAIRVTQRFHYEAVIPLLEGKDSVSTTPEVRQLLADMRQLASILGKRRFAAGALELDLAETKLELDRRGAVTGVKTVEHDESHQIIEEFMLAANIAVALALFDRSWPFIRRVHSDPDLHKLELFSSFVGTLGYSLKQPQSRPALQELIRTVRGEPTEHPVNYALLRSLKQASYSAEEEGHFALAEPHYCHFTSPIRRYADLTVHRLIDSWISGHKKPKGTSVEKLDQVASACSDLSRRAEAAERELVKLKLLRYLANHVGDEIDAVITGVERFGVFCRGINLPAEGLIHISAFGAIAQEIFDYDQSAHALIGRMSGWTLQLGRPLKVKVLSVDPDARKLELAPLAEDFQKHVEETGGKSKKRSHPFHETQPRSAKSKRPKGRPPQSRQPGRRRRGR